MKPGPRNAITDVAGLLVGNAQDDALGTGVTVLTADAPFTAAVHVMGGAPGTRETDLLAPGNLVEAVDALVLSGGSALGLDAAGGVAQGLLAAGRGFAAGQLRVPIVPAAILFDLTPAITARIGDDAGFYRDLGRTALANAAPGFAIGSTGAGTGATTGRLKGGLGSASAILSDGSTLGALVAANPVGSVCHPETGQFWAAPFERGAEFGGRGIAPAPPGPLPTKIARPGQATTIAIVATDATLSKPAARRLAVAAHGGLARAIWPSHTPFDGDLVFAAATGTRPAPDPVGLMALCDAAQQVLARAIARAIHAAVAHEARPVPAWRDAHPG